MVHKEFNIVGKGCKELTKIKNLFVKAKYFLSDVPGSNRRVPRHN